MRAKITFETACCWGITKWKNYHKISAAYLEGLVLDRGLSVCHEREHNLTPGIKHLLTFSVFLNEHSEAANSLI